MQDLRTLPAAEPEFAAYVGIDWADKEHACSLLAGGGKVVEKTKIKQDPETLAAWAASLAARFEGRPVAVCLEQARGPLFYALQQFNHLVLYPMHPAASARYRSVMLPSGSKDDPKDAGLLLDFLLRHRERLQPYQPDTELTRKLRLLVEHRRNLVDERTAATNRIQAALKVYFPQILGWFDEIDAPMVAAFLQRWPTLEVLQKEEPEALRKFFHQHRCRSSKRIDERLEQIGRARPAITDAAVIEPSRMLVETQLGVVAALQQGIAKLENAIQQTAAAHPDYAIFESFPGAGPALAPRLLAAFGSLRDLFDCADQMLSYSGIAPVVSRSGNTKWVHFRWACPKFLRQTFHEFAAASIQQCSWAREFYDQQKLKNKGHHAALRALAFKWIRILYRCWKKHELYTEDTYLRSRLHRASAVEDQSSKTTPKIRLPQPVAPTQAHVQNTVEYQWKCSIGFWTVGSTEA